MEFSIVLTDIKLFASMLRVDSHLSTSLWGIIHSKFTSHLIMLQYSIYAGWRVCIKHFPNLLQIMDKGQQV